jgi:hypothetical protein
MVVVPVVVAMVVGRVVGDGARVTGDVVGVRVRAHRVVGNLRLAFSQTVWTRVQTDRTLVDRLESPAMQG